MNQIKLYRLELKTFTEQNAEDYCLLNNINPSDIKELYLSFNKLTDISGVKLFKNLEKLALAENQLTNISVLKYLNKLEVLYISDNNIKDISVLKYLKKLKFLNIMYLKLESDQIQYINSVNTLKELYCDKGFKDMSVLNQLNKNIMIWD